jgi:hypothetical protein
MTRPGGSMVADVPGPGDSILTKIGGWSEGDKGVLVVGADGGYEWRTPQGELFRGKSHRIRPAQPSVGQTYWSIDGFGPDGFITFDAAATHKTSDGLWAGNRVEPMAVGGRRQGSR